MRPRDAQSGQLSLYLLIFGTVAIIVLSGFIVWADFNLHAVFRDADRAQSFMLAESGIEYYRWHLAHAPQDYQDGTGADGPYEHAFADKDGNPLGDFSLDITEPPSGSTVVTLRSTGQLDADPGADKIIEAQMAVPSLTKFAAVVREFVRFGEGTEIFGPVHSNGGVRVDGVAHNLVTSSVGTVNDPDHSGGVEFGVHTHSAPTDPLPPAAVPDRPDVFMAGREFPVAPVDFVGITQDLADIASGAAHGGFYRDSAGSKKEGYHVVLKTNDTFDLYVVDKTKDAPNGCVSVLGEEDWGTWTIESQTLQGNFPLPANGLLFFADDVWVDGSIDAAHITIGAGVFPENPAHHANIIVNHNLTYTNYDGRDIISLIAQGHLSVGMESDDVLRIDGALVSEMGRIGRYYYKPGSGNQNRCSPYDTRQHITLYGMIASDERYGFAFDDGTGYQTRTLIYDAHLLFDVPPGFPLTANYYTPIFWNEVQ